MEEIVQNALDPSNTIVYCEHMKQIVDDVLTLSKLDAELLVVSPVPVKLSDLMQSAMRIFLPELRMSNINLEVVDDEFLTQHQISWLLLHPNRFLQIIINLITNAIRFTRACGTRKIKVTNSVHSKCPHGIEDIHFVPRRYQPRDRKDSVVDVVKGHEEDILYLRVSVSDTREGLTYQEKRMLFQQVRSGILQKRS